MILQKELPDNGEFVIVKMTKIMPHGAYCRLVEYNLDAYLPIAEVASGWIKNIHEFIKEGQQEVAKVIFVDQAKRAVDVSLKKATTKDKKTKIDDYNFEKRSQGIFTKAIETSGKATEADAIRAEISRTIPTYTELVNDIFEGKDPLASFRDNAFKQALYDLVFKTIKPKSYTVAYNMEMRSTDPKYGARKIKEMLAQVESSGVEVLYLGAPHYKLISTDSSYPKAEAKIKDSERLLESLDKQHAFHREMVKAQ
ncbi:MAG: S1 RNA-binding domain-containing protein [Candidatus Micrarchaeota archaeon]|nr:S1 RNA-binding domain-containing protein [Candidatus Micrarchaeota archaeon]MDE1850115.1 S1 RNA-binding domain-containing protein [Candidatus Micrarchaeota archaeon]MDE1851496.1 S1 RNA-binding domain-containing protein [Candidatus Micrarchaeota archaeon]